MLSVAIVTVTYNAINSVRETIESVLIQDYANMEYLIIDGASTDNTIKMVESYSNRFAEKNIRFTVNSEPDSGIYDAMNKSLYRIDSDYVLFLNAGDVLTDSNTIRKIFCNLDYPLFDVIYGDFYAYSKPYIKKKKSYSPDMLRRGMICTHQAIFTKVSLLRERPYDTGYKMAADYDFYLDMYLKGKKFHYVAVHVVYFDISGTSQKRARITQNERLEIKLHYGCISNKEYNLNRKNIKWICLRKRIISALPKTIRFHSYDLIQR